MQPAEKQQVRGSSPLASSTSEPWIGQASSCFTHALKGEAFNQVNLGDAEMPWGAEVDRREVDPPDRGPGGTGSRAGSLAWW